MCVYTHPHIYVCIHIAMYGQSTYLEKFRNNLIMVLLLINTYWLN